MDIKYKNPPVIEAVCEFRFSNDVIWEDIIPGIIYEKIKDEFPNRNQRIVQEMSVQEKAPGEIEQKINRYSLVQFSDTNRNNLIQVGQRLFSVNALQPYITWENYSELIKRMLDILVGVIKSLNTNSDEIRFSRIGLRYINRISIPGIISAKTLGDYIIIAPRIPETLVKNNLNSFLSGFIWDFNKSDNCKVELTTTIGDANFSNYSLDIDYSTDPKKAIEISKVPDWVENAHNNLKMVFESTISDSLRYIFERI